MRFRTIVRLAVAVGAFLTLSANDGIIAEELACEEALKHYTDCCHVEAHESCYVGRGCDDHSHPWITSSGVDRRLLASSCEELIASGTCGNLDSLKPPGYGPPRDLSVADQAAPPDLARYDDDGGDM